jgi:hypothetical protein
MPCKEPVRTLENTPMLYRPCTASFGTGSPEMWEIVDLENESQGCFGAVLAR